MGIKISIGDAEDDSCRYSRRVILEPTRCTLTNLNSSSWMTKDRGAVFYGCARWKNQLGPNVREKLSRTRPTEYLGASEKTLLRRILAMWPNIITRLVKLSKRRMKEGGCPGSRLYAKWIGADRVNFPRSFCSGIANFSISVFQI